MSQFFKKFLCEESSRLGSTPGRFLALGAFGKHPGWDDHIEDLGLETETLTLAKRILYVQGVGGQIDTGAWEKLEPAQRKEGFDHIFVWQRARQFLLGRMWSSSDGKGRTRYPMVLCAQCSGVSLAWGLQVVLPRLLDLEQKCKGTNSAQSVRSALDSTRLELRAHLGDASAGGTFAPVELGELNQFVANSVFGPDQQGWLRVLYQVENQMAAYGPGNFSPKTNVTSLRPQAVRVPLAASSPEQALLLWTRFFNTQFERTVPLFMAVAPGQSWLDAVVGEPGSQEFFCLRALPAVLPLATEVPYTIDDSFKTQAKTALGEFSSGKDTAFFFQKPQAEERVGALASLTQRFFRKGTKLILLGGGVLIAGAAAWYFTQGQRHSAQPTAPQTAATTAPPQSVTSAPPQAVTTAQTAPPNAVTTTPAQTPPQQSAPQIPPPQAVAATPQTTPPNGVAPTPHPHPTPTPPVVSARPPPNTSIQAAVSPSSGSVTPGAQTNLPDTTKSSSPATPTTTQVPAPPSSLRITESAPMPTNTSPNLVASAPTAHQPLLTNGTEMVMAWIPSLPGTSDGAWVGKFEVTQKQFQRVMDSNPSKSKDPAHPVESVTWQEALDFCGKLTASEKAVGTLPSGFIYALPTQAQWDFFLSDAKFDDAVTSRTCTPVRESPFNVGTLPPNQLGLYDVLGNVWEWCSDNGTNSERFVKGSAFNSTTRLYFGKPLDRTTPRRLAADSRSPEVGFRCILAPAP